MNQYTPFLTTQEFSLLNRRVTKREYEKVVQEALDMGLQNGFIQEGNTAEKSFLPYFET
jgi:putative pyruvate formate lyase activating enzyme